MTRQRILKVAVPCPLYRIFDYLLPPVYQQQAIQPGMRVRISFGRQKLIAIIIEETGKSELPPEKLKPILELLDHTSLIPMDIIELLLWSARYYAHPVGDVFQTALPVYLRNHDDATPALSEFWRINTLADTDSDTVLQSLSRAPRQQQIYRLLNNVDRTTDEHAGLDADALNSLTENWRAPLKSLLNKQLIIAEYKPTLLVSNDNQTKTIPLNEEQLAAVQAIEGHVSTPATNKHAVHVLNGVTGSGKTEVYLALCKTKLAENKQILILVPEIGLTPQLTKRFQQHLDTSLVVLHSAMNNRQRYAAWSAAANNQAQLVIGTRSSIFTPLPNLGLIIIDEEHDGSYKQQDGFRYNARDLAILRAKNKQLPIVLGSATPSLETLNNINEQRYQVYYLRHRANKKPLPKISLINLCSQKLQESLSDTLLAKIKQHLQQQGQILLFINRRGFAPLLMCHECGWTTNCQRCDAHMTYHKRRNQLHCHHCGSQRPAPETCEECGSSKLLAIGAGTERIESFLQAQFSDTKVSRIDRDSTRNKGSLQEKLDEAHSGEAGILVGTQMLAKGHDFPNITLVAILDTDQALFSADFRAAEHLAQLITQVSGRAGRADKPGEVLIQTHHPEHPLLQNLLHKGYQAYAQEALQERHSACLPPAHHLVLLRCESVDSQAAQSFLQQALTCAKQIDSDGVELFGPLPAPMERRAGRFRYQIMLQAKQRKPLHRFLSWWPAQLQTLPGARKVRWSIDVDPYDTF